LLVAVVVGLQGLQVLMRPVPEVVLVDIEHLYLVSHLEEEVPLNLLLRLLPAQVIQ
jgi:hypothetical protein